MSMEKKLAVVLADTYALYLKTQGYHWHVKGPQFKSLHELFEAHYQELAEAVDAIAERILMLGGQAPASFKEFMALKTLKDGDTSSNSEHMLADLCEDHDNLLKTLQATMSEANDQHDEGTMALLSERIAHHEKMRWMLNASR